MNKKTESALQVECFTWFHNTYPEHRGLLFSVPNGGKRTQREAARLKLEGLTPGVPDLLFIYQKRIHAFELKTDIGVISPEQAYIHDQWHKNGINVHIIREFRMFKRAIYEILSE